MVDPGTDPQELLTLAREVSAASRRALLATITGFFGDDEEVLTERERALMRDILSKLLRETELALRRDLVETLRNRADAPQEILPALTDGDIEMVRPVLMTSPVLRDPPLIETIRHRTLQHQLAIAMRRLVTAEVAESLVEPGNADVIKALLESDNSDVAGATMEYLVEESRRVDSYQEPLVKREALPADLSRRLCLWVAAAVRRAVLERFEIDPTALDEALLAAVGRLSPQASDTGTRAARSAAAALAARLIEEGEIAPQQMVHVLRDGEVSLFEALLGHMSGLEAPRLQRVVYESDGRSMAIACRAIGIEKPVFASLFLLCRKGRPSEKLGDSQEVAEVMALFDRIDPKSAASVLRLWQREWPYQDAIDQV